MKHIFSLILTASLAAADSIDVEIDRRIQAAVAPLLQRIEKLESGGLGTLTVNTGEELDTALGIGGTVLVDGDITLTKYAHVRVKGTTLKAGPNGGKLTIDWTEYPNHVVFVAADDVLIEGLELTSAQGMAPGAIQHRAIAIGKPGTHRNLTLRGLHIHDIPWGIRLDGSPAAPFIDGLRIEDCQIEGFSHGGIVLVWNGRDVTLRGNHIRGRREGETHAVEHNGIWIGEQMTRVYVTGNTVLESDRWGIEVYYNKDVRVTDNHVEECDNGISMGGGNWVCNSNIVRNFTGGVGGIELVGWGTSVGNYLDGGPNGLCGFAVNADTGPPDTEAIVVANDIRNCKFAVQVYKGGGTQRVTASVFVGNRIQAINRNGAVGQGIFFNNSGTPASGNSCVVGNLFDGVFSGAIYNFGGAALMAKDNLQVAPLQSGETIRRNGLLYNNDGKFITDDAGALSAGIGYQEIGANLRLVP